MEFHPLLSSSVIPRDPCGSCGWLFVHWRCRRFFRMCAGNRFILRWPPLAVEVQWWGLHAAIVTVLECDPPFLTVLVRPLLSVCCTARRQFYDTKR
uniref:Uncharacterized protein n=1 Tax=Anguilla anguilla TaxID=7936 RepID=A0A0E9RTI9_ANGAN